MRYIALCRLYIGTILAFSFAGSAHAASFNCEKASGKVERAICHHSELSALDEEMSAAYLTLKKDPLIVFENLRVRQQTFLTERNLCAGEKNLPACLAERYHHIINEYQQLPVSVDKDKFEFNNNIQKTHLRFAITPPDWPWRAEIYMRSRGCADGTWCESSGYLAIKDTTTGLLTQVIYLPRAFFFTEPADNTIRLSYNDARQANRLLTLMPDTKGSGTEIIIPCTSRNYDSGKNTFRYIDSQLYFLIDKNSCAHAID